jgi:glucose/arabinose dehydrogenase
MPRHQRLTATALGVLLATALVAGCSDDGTDAAPTTASTTSTTTSTTSPTTTTTTPAPSQSSAPTAAPPTEAPAPPPQPAATTPPQPLGYDFSKPDVAVNGLDAPWGLAFLPDASALVTERDSGRILRVVAGQPATEVARIEGVVHVAESGLLGIAASPAYAQDGLVYVYFTTASDNRIARFRLGEQPQVIVSGIQQARFHNGGRLAFGPDGMLYATTGDATNRATAQDPTSLNGKILRMRPDGTPPPDNPDPSSLVWSLGHRNVQGLAWDSSGRMFAPEFGQDRLDEVNLIRPGGNYGWPQVEGPGGGGQFVDPLVTWSTDESSPSGAAISGDSLYVAALRGQRLWRIPLTADGLGAPEVALAGVGRIRAVAVAPDGALWVMTNNTDGRGAPRSGDDQILRFAPV